MTIKGVLLKMKKLTKVSKRKHAELNQPTEVGCRPSLDISCIIPNKKLQTGFNPNMDYNPQRDDGTAVASALPPAELFPENKETYVLKTPEKLFQGDSLLVSLPMDMLVEIMCRLHHDDLPVVSQVSRTLCHAVNTAWDTYFNYRTPDHSRQQAMKSKALASNDEGNTMLESPQCPGAPVHGHACIYLKK